MFDGSSALQIYAFFHIFWNIIRKYDKGGGKIRISYSKTGRFSV